MSSLAGGNDHENCNAATDPRPRIELTEANLNALALGYPVVTSEYVIVVVRKASDRSV